MPGAKSGQTEHPIPEQTEHMIPEMAEHLKPERKHHNINAKRLYNLITNRLLTLNRNRVLTYTGICSEVNKLKSSVAIWNNPRQNCIIGLNDVCNLLFLTRSQVRKLASEGEIPSHKFQKSGQLYFVEDELINHIKNRIA